MVIIFSSCKVVCENSNDGYQADGCHFWTWDAETQICYLKNERGWHRESKSLVISGNKNGTTLWPQTALVGGDLNRMFVPCTACQVQLGTDDGTYDGPEDTQGQRCQKICESTIGCAWWHVWGPTCATFHEQEFEVDFEAGTGRISGSKDGRHHWFEITTDAEWMHDERCCRKIAP